MRRRVTSDKWRRVTSLGFLLLLVTGYCSSLTASPLPLPTYSPVGGTYLSAVGKNTKAVTIKGSPKARILYTTDGSDPRKGVENGLLPQLAPVKVELPIGRVALKAVQLVGSQESKVKSNTYTITPRSGSTPTPSPTATPSPIPTPTPSPTPTSETVTLQWDANPEPDIAGYRVHYGKTSGTYTETKDVGKVTTTPVLIEWASAWYFAVTAYNEMGEESDSSTEVSYQP